MDQGDYERAAKLFDEVERQHPYSVWARRAQLMSAFNYYLAKKYNDSISSAQRFVTIHPGNAEAPYAQYLIAMSYYQQIADVSRDQAITQQASDAFGELIRRFPGTRYAADARLKLDLINDHLAGKEMEVGRFYQRSGNWLASTYRFRTVVEK
jgi:outer membrane protein assembly factor BamD